MAALPTVTVDSLGNRNAYGLPALRDDPGTPADRQQLLRVSEMRRRDPPAQWTDDAHQMARSFHSAVYIAVNTVMTAMAGAEVVVLQRQKGRVSKSQASSAAGSRESEWTPVEHDHPISRLFANPNEKDTASDFLAEYTLCRCLFGQGTVMWYPGKGDRKPAELWNLRKNYLSATVGLSPDYPRGAYQYTSTGPFLGWNAGGTMIIPRERLVLHKRPHPIFPWDSHSPLTGGNKLVDMLNGTIDAIKGAMDKGLSLDAVIAMAGASPDQLEQMDKRIAEKFVGANRGQRFLVGDGESVDVKMLGSTPDKMAFGENYEKGTAAVLALFGVPAVCAYLADSDYSGFYASARAWREGSLGGEANSIGQRWTKDLILPHWGPDYRVEIKLAPLMDPDQKERQWAMLTGATSANTYTINEIRASVDMKPVEWGDVTPAEFSATMQQKQSPQPGGMPGGPQPGAPADPLAALLGGNPNAEPFAPGDLEGPDVGDASAGSLPGKVQKSLSDYFAGLVEEVCKV
jgi:hypothetical protein